MLKPGEWEKEEFSGCVLIGPLHKTSGTFFADSCFDWWVQCLSAKLLANRAVWLDNGNISGKNIASTNIWAMLKWDNAKYDILWQINVKYLIDDEEG